MGTSVFSETEEAREMDSCDLCKYKIELNEQDVTLPTEIFDNVLIDGDM